MQFYICLQLGNPSYLERTLRLSWMLLVYSTKVPITILNPHLPRYCDTSETEGDSQEHKLDPRFFKNFLNILKIFVCFLITWKIAINYYILWMFSFNNVDYFLTGIMAKAHVCESSFECQSQISPREKRELLEFKLNLFT